MAVPVVNAVINFSTGPGFAQACLIDSGVFGTNIFADAAAVIVDVSDQINLIQTNRGRNAVADQLRASDPDEEVIDNCYLRRSYLPYLRWLYYWLSDYPA
jgi:hypothetical protein